MKKGCTPRTVKADRYRDYKCSQCPNLEETPSQKKSKQKVRKGSPLSPSLVNSKQRSNQSTLPLHPHITLAFLFLAQNFSVASVAAAVTTVAIHASRSTTEVTVLLVAVELAGSSTLGIDLLLQDSLRTHDLGEALQARRLTELDAAQSRASLLLQGP